ncbi:MltF family protein [Pseudomonas sp. TAE6080]|uniref:transglycosylase SLT domain-containing protein n=1 Tax=Pseudomonas sp. TAE6080 TaxID=2840374 RepID=UPI001158667A|nr:lytic transglycosylase F [Pseudomonas sp. TAE6080]MBT9303183.1 lytic transglycosylase F [Pseudomonas sp. TAE6080]
MLGIRGWVTHFTAHPSARSVPITHILAVLAFTLFAGAIDAAAEAKAPPEAPLREQLTLPTESAMKPWTGDLDGMIDRQIIRVLTVYSKTFYFVDRGVQRGTTYDFFRVFEEDLNKKLAKDKKLKHKALKVRVVLIPVARDELLPALAAGKGDIAASNLTVTEERKQLVDFTSPVYRNVSEVVVSGPDSPAVSSVDELAGQVVFVRKSSSYYESLMALNQRFAGENKPAVILKEAPEALEDEDLIEMLNAGMIPLIVVDKHKADFWKKVFPAITVHDDVTLRTGGEIAWAIRKGSPQLQAFTNDFITRHGQGTAIGNMILTRFFRSEKYVKASVSESERKKFIALVQYFQQYGDKYDVDWLLMAAQGYQESQLNQAAKSKVGAIGVMQVMPATGKELGVGNIAEVEPNINAGIKYMRWMIDQYYGKEPMTNLDKALFAFASYNAGAGRISKLRKEATLRGLDPNVWFHNVEYVAAEKIGAETVTYVSNIYKYYIAYQLIMQANAAKAEAAQTLKDQSKELP